jgi:hypothetical protein
MTCSASSFKRGRNHYSLPKFSRASYLLKLRMKTLWALSIFFSLLVSGTAAGVVSAQGDAAPGVGGVQLRKVGAKDQASGRVPVILAVTGENLSAAPADISMRLVSKKDGRLIDVAVDSVAENEIVAKAFAPAGEYIVELRIKGAKVVSASDYELELQEEAGEVGQPAKPFGISFETFKSEQYPNLYSVLITNRSDGEGFAADPSLMKVDILPAGTTNLTIQPGSTPQQMMVTFLAPEKFEVKGVIVTVYRPDSPRSENRLARYSTPFKEKPAKADPNQPQITGIDILSLQRRTGIGRLKIEGSGFGDYERPPIPGDRELLCCLNRPSQSYERRKAAPAQNPEAEINPAEASDSEVCAAVLMNGSACGDMRAWRKKIEQRVNVVLVPRNADLRVERTQILYVDDKVIDLYFEFTHFPGYSQPFRLQSATVTVNKGGVKSSETVRGETPAESRASHAAGTAAPPAVTGTVKGPATFVVSHDVGLKRDKNLEYRYSILEQKDASRLFGSGVGDHFYVMELSVVNNGEKKVNVPLSAIQAEIEWAYGGGDEKANLFFEEGPATVSPMPLGAISAYFDLFQKSQGRKARLFNVLEGMSTLAATLVPVFGNGLAKSNNIFQSGFLPGLRLALGDLSSQQLQNLTTMSWENVEEIPAGAGINKFIYVQRGDQVFGRSEGGFSKSEKSKDGLTQVKKTIMNIRGLEVAGFEVLESEKKLGTQQQ